ncbi:HAMP domain-containing histidine kinase [Myroides odoratimimus]|uniref:sensor histidine kinase n=1 Tax=Myroides odoratimimus TaxID=76832 RepID=UPI0025781F8E|nr:HAMP domain-containing sensor histidine kinase [Myroides odoratimimus]MDM1398490.1 HAMP domain-containing histidine kinase [Myroides odoratimimus]
MKKLNSKYYLIIFCVFYILLLGLMGFYFNQAIRLKQKAINSLAHEKIDDLLEQSSYKNMSLNKESELYKHFLALKKQETSIDIIKEDYNHNSELFTTKVDSTFKELGYKVAAKFTITQITLNDKNINLLDEPFTFLETNEKVVHPQKINTSEWEINETSTLDQNDNHIGVKNDKDLHITVHQEKEIEVVNYLSIVLKQLLPLFIGSSLICIFILVLYYITYRTIKHKEKEVANLYNMVDNVSHEFKLPIATLKYGCKNLSKEYDSPTINLLLRQVNRLDRLQNSLNPVLSDEEESYKKEDALVLIEDLQNLYPEALLSLKWSAKEELNLPKTKIETVLLNLLENSIKYGGTEIKCSVSSDANQYIITVIDNGMGIAKDKQSDIFKKFYRIREGNIHNTQGLGIGLYQVQQIVKSLHGSININSKLQVGTTFKITIPYV